MRPDPEAQALAHRVEKLAASIAPDERGELPSAVLWAISLADQIAPDPDCEPGLGWSTAYGPPSIYRSTRRSDYERSHCQDLERGLEYVHESRTRRERPKPCEGLERLFASLGIAPAPSAQIIPLQPRPRV